MSSAPPTTDNSSRKVQFERIHDEFDATRFECRPPPRSPPLVDSPANTVTPARSISQAKPVVGHERSASCFAFRRVGSTLLEGGPSTMGGQSNRALTRTPSSRSFGTFGEFRRPTPDRSQELTGLTASDRYIIEYFTYQYQKECLDEGDLSETGDSQISPSSSFASIGPNRPRASSSGHHVGSANKSRQEYNDGLERNEDGSAWASSATSPNVRLWDLLGPPAWSLVLLLVMLVSDTALVVFYQEEDEFVMCAWTVAVPNFVCICLLGDRLLFGLFSSRAQARGRSVRFGASLWYIITTPLLRALPLVTLMSSSFDKALMLSGDPTDTTEFVVKQERRAFNDLVWFGPLYCLPMAGLQVYGILFNKLARKEPTILIFQLISAVSCTLLAAVVSSTYSFWVRPSASTAASNSSIPSRSSSDGASRLTNQAESCNPALQLLDSTENILTVVADDDDNQCLLARRIVVRLTFWFCIILAKVVALAVFIKLVGPLWAIGAVFLIRLPFVCLLACISDVTWSVCDVLGVSAMCSTYVIAFTRLGPVRERLERPRSLLLHVGGCFVEALAAIMAAVFSESITLQRATNIVMFEGMLLATGTLFLLIMQRLSRTRLLSSRKG